MSPGLERRVFVRRRMLDVAVDTDSAAVHDALARRLRRRLDHRADGRRVHRAVLLVAQAGLPVDRGDVVDDVDAARRRALSDGRPRRSPATTSIAERRERGARVAGSRTSARTCVAARRQRPGEVTAGEPGGAGD